MRALLRLTSEPDFAPRHRLDASKLIELFGWSEEEFLKRTEGSAVRRAGYEGWLRNIAVGLGNAPTNSEIIAALNTRGDHPSALVREHVAWALSQHQVKYKTAGRSAPHYYFTKKCSR